MTHLLKLRSLVVVGAAVSVLPGISGAPIEEGNSAPHEVETTVVAFVDCLKNTSSNPQLGRICGAIVSWLPQDLTVLKECLIERNRVGFRHDDGTFPGSRPSWTLTMQCRDRRSVNIVLLRKDGNFAVDHVAEILE